MTLSLDNFKVQQLKASSFLIIDKNITAEKAKEIKAKLPFENIGNIVEFKKEEEEEELINSQL